MRDRIVLVADHCLFIYWRQNETPHQKRYITCYMNVIHMFIFVFALHFMTNGKFGSLVTIFQNYGRPTILKDATCAHDTNAFAMKFRKSLKQLFYKQEIIKQKSKRNKNGKRREYDDVETAMLKYGRNEKMTFFVFIDHERQKLFWGIFIFIRRVPPSNLVGVTFLLTSLWKGYILRRRHKRYWPLMAEIAVLMFFFLYSVARL